MTAEQLSLNQLTKLTYRDGQASFALSLIALQSNSS